ncbi:CPBP family intramembrane glutamic endopeptidase [Demequina sp. NBRC 110056]|uniref:CPBP family intramembrane glutamic endopeptidase n=1 Tax=Demequina sp. NBRC 110056 TaxID=1570345 RepID=UPI000A02BA15|nr:CPBP family intramembrane glutamic endopeptidase [Demequina sp. NBRC 110056]
MATEQLPTSRVRPSLWVALAVFVIYCAIVVVMWTINDVDYASVQDSTQQAVDGIVVPIAIGSVFLIVATTVLGWWRPAIAEPRRSAPRWMIVIPLLFGVGGLVTVAGSDLGAIETGHLLAILGGVALVGFAEELLNRGVLVVGARGKGGEVFVWFVTCLMFGLLHAINAFFGQGAGQTVLQIVMAFLFGSIFYISRRATGTIILGMIVHALWDAGTLTAAATDSADAALPSLGGFLGPVAMVIAVVALFFVFRYDLNGQKKVKAAA